MIVFLNSKSFTSQKGNKITILNVLNKESAKESYSGNVEVQAESYFLSAARFPSLDFRGGEILNITWGRDYKGQAVPLTVESSGEFEPSISEFLSE